MTCWNRILFTSFACCFSATVALMPSSRAFGATPTIDTGQSRCYSDSSEIACPKHGEPYYGQDAQFEGPAMNYRDNGDGTVTDLYTGLMWSKAVDAKKLSLAEAQKVAGEMTLGGYRDWRVPTIKELYSLIDFRGYTGFSGSRTTSSVPINAIPFINTDYFDFAYGDINSGERYIDAQWLSSTKYVSTTMGGMETLFGVNFADGRIKGYGFRRVGSNRSIKTFFARYVRGSAYGSNDFVDNGDGTVTDRSSGLMWMQSDSGKGMNWQDALAYAEKLDYAGYDDWRLPNAKELQYIVDYSRAPDTTGSAAIDPMFRSTAIINEADQKDYPFYWTSTTHSDGPNPADNAAYIAFGRAIGQMRGKVMDVHGAGAQRSDPKTGQPRIGHGPQGDAQRIDNYVRCVRGGNPATAVNPFTPDADNYPNKIKVKKLKVENTQQIRKPGAEEAQPQPGFGRMPGSPPSGAGFIQRLDRNNDGKISRSEFDGPARHFADFDTDQDGYISAEEAPKGPPPRRK